MANKIVYACVIAVVCTLAMIALTDAQGEKPVTDICLGCICEAISGCNQTAICTGGVCGLFRITWAYWSDGGKLTINGEDPGSETDKPVTDVCLGCICQVISGCNQSTRCNDDVCGLFRITYDYWSDGGKLTINGENPGSQSAYANCVNDAYCAGNTIQNYMSRYGRDCNNDSVVDCVDYTAIHIYGPDGCKGGMTNQLKNKLNDCVNNFKGIDIRSNF